MKRLVVISHTEHYTRPDGTLVGHGATVTEINHLLALFDEVTHLAMWHDDPAPASALPYASSRIRFVALPTVGGPRWQDKWDILRKAPRTLRLVRRYVRSADCFQFRAPTGIGVYVVPYLMTFSVPGWFKYAGNWKQKHAPPAYRFQRFLLKHQGRKVTLNGQWDDMPGQGLAFENPCLTAAELEQGTVCVANKRLEPEALEFCFAGRLEAAKGIDLLLEAFEKLSGSEKQKIRHIHIVGEGARRAAYESRAQQSGLPFVFHGLLSRPALHELYQRAHFFILPSASEGFPKVVSEAMNYGCIPVVSDVSSLRHYIRDGHNGFLLHTLHSATVEAALHKLLQLTPEAYALLLEAVREGIVRFSYAYYNRRI